MICNEGGSLQTTNFEDENTSDFEVPQQAVLLEGKQSSFLENSVTQHAFLLLESEESSDSENRVPQQAVLAESEKPPQTLDPNNGNTADSDKGEPLQIIQTIREEIDGKCLNKMELNEKNLEKVLSQTHIKDTPIVVVSVAGALRKGKSFLLGFFLKYFDKQVSLFIIKPIFYKI